MEEHGKRGYIAYGELLVETSTFICYGGLHSLGGENMTKSEEALARGLALQLMSRKGVSFEYERPSIEEAKQLTAKYRPWYIQLTSLLFFNNELGKLDWDAIIDAAIAPEMILSVYEECLEERRKQDVRF